MSKMNRPDMVFDDVSPSGAATEEESKVVLGASRKSRKGTNAFDSDDDEDDFFDALDHFQSMTY